MSARPGTYTASHTVTQAELDAGTPIVNVATATGTGATPDSDDASVAVVQSKILHIEKDARFRVARPTWPARRSATRWR